MRFDRSAFETAFHQVFDEPLLSIDSHVGGEPARLVVAGVPALEGNTTNDKRLYLSKKEDAVRLLTTREPRGHRDMFASILVEPESADAAFGLVYMDARRYPYLCGHATIAAVSAMIELGLIEPTLPDMPVVVDTPSGPWRTVAHVRENPMVKGRPFIVDSVSIQPEMSFAYKLDQEIDVKGSGRIKVDISYTGGFFAMVSADQISLELKDTNASQLALLGMNIMDAANEQLTVRHPLKPYIDTIDVVEFFDPRGHKDKRGKNFVVFGESHVDRSPCGTGTCAKLALLHKRGQIKVGEKFVNEGLTGTTFDAKVTREILIKDPENRNDLQAIIPEVSGKAHITGLHQFVLTNEDPFPEGFLI